MLQLEMKILFFSFQVLEHTLMFKGIAFIAEKDFVVKHNEMLFSDCCNRLKPWSPKLN